MRNRALLLVASLVLAGCSDDAAPGDAAATLEGGSDAGRDSGNGIGNDVEPELYPGGGTGGGAIHGRLNVYVVDGADDSPLQGALVMLGDGATDSATTDPSGLASFRRPGLSGPVTATVGLGGYTTSTIVGLDAANLTVGLDSRSPAAPTVKTGMCSGSVKDWASLPAPAQGHLRVAYAGNLWSKDLGDPANDVQQPPGDLNLFAPALGKTSWKLKVPAGDSIGIYVAVLDVDTKGTSDVSDDERILTHIGMVRELKVGESQILANIQVPVAQVSETLRINLPAQFPSGTDEAGVGVLVQHASGVLLPIFFPVPGTNEYLVPSLSGEFAGGNYWVIATAKPTGEPDTDRKTESLVLHRNITDTSKAVQISLLALPSNIALQGRSISFSAPAGMALQTAKLFPELSGAPYWSVTFAHQSAPVQFELPALPQGADAEQIPAGKLLLHVSVMDIPGADLNNARFEELADLVAGSSQTGAPAELH